MDDHSTSWAAVALVFVAGYGIGAASLALGLGLWRVLRQAAQDE